jgi:hypothetical protein
MATVFQQLETEWRRLSHDRRAAHELRHVCHVAGNATSLAEVERYVRTALPADTDRVLLALVRRAVLDDALAARVLLQLLLPGTRRLARQWWALGDTDERAAAAVLAVYHRIRHYPVLRRPSRIAANILMDAAKELRRAVPSTNLVLSADPATHLQFDPAAPHPAVELADLLHEAVHEGTLRPDDAQLIARSRIAGQPVADIAHHRGLHPRTLWDRRKRAEDALATAHQG